MSGRGRRSRAYRIVVVIVIVIGIVIVGVGVIRGGDLDAFFIDCEAYEEDEHCDKQVEYRNEIGGNCSDLALIATGC